jgi:glycosyltransferase involved in cell wall biosynthesis
MRLCYLTEESISFREPLSRGGAIHVRNVVSGLRERGHEVFLLDWNTHRERPFHRPLRPRSRFVLDPLRTVRHAISVGRATDVDAIVSKTRKTYLPGLVAARRLGVPHVVHVGSSLDRPAAGLADRLTMASVPARLRAPHDGYLVVCTYIADQLRAQDIGEARIANVKNAVDTDRFHPSTVPEPLEEQYERRLAGASDGLTLGFIGSVHADKGVFDLAAALERTDRETTLVVAGDGPARERLAETVDSAVFLGSVPYEQIPAVYHHLDAFVLPSHTEGLPRVVLEAQATATPLIATRVGGIPEVVTDGETGLLCPARNPGALAAAIDRLGDRDLREHLATQGRDAVVETYAWDRLYDRYETALGRWCDG